MASRKRSLARAEVNRTATHFFLVAVLVAALCASSATLAQAGITQISPLAELVAADGVSGDGFGASVALSGSTLVVGSPYSAGVGGVYIFTGSGATWTQIAKLTASDGTAGSQFGYAVALSGNTVAVGAPQQGGETGGAVYLFVEPAEGWANMTETAKLTYQGDVFGYSVAFGGQGKFVLTSALFQNAAYVFAKPATGWVTSSIPSANLVAPAGATGFGTAIAANGMIAVVGAETTNNESGAAYVFPLQTGVTNINSVAALTPSDSGGFLGERLAMDGNTVVAGAQGHDNGVGAVYVFVEPTTGWTDMTETAELTIDHRGQTAFGAGLAASPGVIFVGLPSGREGYVVNYVKPATGWANSSIPNLEFAPSLGSNAFGEIVSLSGTTLAAGDFSFNQGQGAVYIFGTLR
jgi:FG-GAP repeat